MLTCRDVNHRASALVDGELGLRERLAVRMHLLMCTHCRRFTRQLEWLVRSLRESARSGGMPEGFVDSVMRQLGDVDPPDPDQTPRAD